MKVSVHFSLYLYFGVTLAYRWPGHRCRDDQFWFSITGECEPCGRICDPPGRHENDCPNVCPNYVYKPITTTVAPNTTTSNTSRSVTQVGEHTGSSLTGSSSSPTITVVLIVMGVIVAVLCNLGIGCFLYKKRNSIKFNVLLRQIFGKTKYPTTAKAVQPKDDPKEPDQDQDHQAMLPAHAYGDIELAPQADEDLSAITSLSLPKDM